MWGHWELKRKFRVKSGTMSTSISQSNPTLDRLEDQISWYDNKSRVNQRWYKWLKLLTMVSAVFVPVLSVPNWGRHYVAALGIIIVLAEGIQQLNQFQANWIAYRSTCESLRHEKYLYLAQAGPYQSTDKPITVLAERIEGLVSQEHAKWVSAQNEAGKKTSQATAP
jgi:hypothetical protein